MLSVICDFYFLPVQALVHIKQHMHEPLLTMQGLVLHQALARLQSHEPAALDALTTKKSAHCPVLPMLATLSIWNAKVYLVAI